MHGMKKNYVMIAIILLFLVLMLRNLTSNLRERRG